MSSNVYHTSQHTDDAVVPVAALRLSASASFWTTSRLISLILHLHLSLWIVFCFFYVWCCISNVVFLCILSRTHYKLPLGGKSETHFSFAADLNICFPINSLYYISKEMSQKLFPLCSIFFSLMGEFVISTCSCSYWAGLYLITAMFIVEESLPISLSHSKSNFRSFWESINSSVLSVAQWRGFSFKATKLYDGFMTMGWFVKDHH